MGEMLVSRGHRTNTQDHRNRLDRRRLRLAILIPPGTSFDAAETPLRAADLSPTSRRLEVTRCGLRAPTAQCGRPPDGVAGFSDRGGQQGRRVVEGHLDESRKFGKHRGGSDRSYRSDQAGRPHSGRKQVRAGASPARVEKTSLTDRQSFHENSPVVLRATSNLMSGVAAYFQCLYAIPSFRNAVLSYSPPPRAQVDFADYRDYWKGDSSSAAGISSLGMPIPVGGEQESRETRKFAVCRSPLTYSGLFFFFFFFFRVSLNRPPAPCRSHRFAAPLCAHARDASVFLAHDRSRPRVRDPRERFSADRRRLGLQDHG